jgi:hypothetical protein
VSCAVLVAAAICPSCQLPCKLPDQPSCFLSGTSKQ